MNERLSSAINTWAFNYALKWLSFSNRGNTDFRTYKDKKGIVWYVTPFFAARPASNDVHVRGREMEAFTLLDKGIDFAEYEIIHDTGTVLEVGHGKLKKKIRIFKNETGKETRLSEGHIKTVMKYCHFMRRKNGDDIVVLIFDSTDGNLIGLTTRIRNSSEEG